MKKILFLMLFIGLTACDKDFLTEEAKDIIAADNLYNSYEGFQAGLNGLYAYALIERKVNGNGNVFSYSTPAIQGTDIAWAQIWLGPWNNGYNTLGADLNSETRHIYDIWSWLYQTINAANTIVNRSEGADIDWQGADNTENEVRKNQVLAQAKTIRAWAYRHLTNQWNNVPLILEESSGDNIKYDWLPTSRKEVETEMEKDWLFAIEHLPEVQEIPGRLSKAVPRHYLAELYLVWGEYGKAETMAKAITESGDFSLITGRYGVKQGEPGTPYSDMFFDGNVSRTQGNTEVLWSFQREFQTIGGENHSNMRRWFKPPYFLKYKGVSLEITMERGGRGFAGVFLTPFAVDMFGPADDRGNRFNLTKYYVLTENDKITTDEFVVGDTLHMDWSLDNQYIRSRGWPSLNKFDYSQENDLKIAKSYKDAPYLRLADTYLLLAEAQIGGNKLTDAAESINIVRRRANAPDITAAEVDIDFLLDERARELCFEVCRKYALVRNNKYVERVQNHNKMASPNVAEQYRYLPVPQQVRDANPEYPQNPGYN